MMRSSVLTSVFVFMAFLPTVLFWGESPGTNEAIIHLLTTFPLVGALVGAWLKITARGVVSMLAMHYSLSFAMLWLIIPEVLPWNA